MFKLFKTPPEIPEELDFTAQAQASGGGFRPIRGGQAAPGGGTAGSRVQAGNHGRHCRQAVIQEGNIQKTRWPLAVAGAVLFAAVAFGTYYAFETWNAPVPAEIPKGDIFAALATVPNAAPPGSPAASPKPAPTQPAQQAPAAPQNPAQQLPMAALPVQPAGSGAPPAKAENPAPKPQEAAKPDAPRQELSTEASQTLFSGIFGDNPFVDLSSLRSMVTASASAGRNLPHIGASGNMALPEVPRPVVSPDLLPSPGEIRTPAAPGGAAQKASTMGGIIKSSDGSAIAIMGDGTVLSEGDTYKGDRRVTFVGGEGISFDDGNTIAFGQGK